MLGDWENSCLCLEDGIKPAAANLINLQSIYSNCLEGDLMVLEESDKYCECGCGQKTLMGTLSHKPNRFVHGHNSKGKNHPMFGKKHTKESLQKMSDSTKGQFVSEDTRQKLRVALAGREFTTETLQKIKNSNQLKPLNPDWIQKHKDGCIKRSDNKEWQNNQIPGAKKRVANPIWKAKNAIAGYNNLRKYHDTITEEQLHDRGIRISAGHQGISVGDWESFACDKPYCSKFNESCKESNREKYDRKCFICGLPESENITKTNKHRKLSVHHVDINKNQGCGGTKWKLIPVCFHCHGFIHTDTWVKRLEYILKNTCCDYNG